MQIPEDGFSDDKGGVDVWLAEQVQDFGETRPVAPLSAGEYAPMDSLTELLRMMDR